MNLEYREPHSKSELQALFQMRQEVFAGDPFLSKMVKSNSAIDINGFDVNALHFGAFELGKPVAYIRIATTHKTSFTNWVHNIIANQQMHIAQQDFQFPFLTYYPDLKWSQHFLDSLKDRNIGEVGKLAIKRDYRKGGETLNRLIQSFIHYCKFNKGIDTGFGICALKLARYYKRFGFKPAHGARNFVYQDLPKAIVVRFDK